MKNEITATRLKQALGISGKTAAMLSSASGVSQSSISQYLAGSHKPSNLSAGLMAEILGVNPVWLMGFDVPMEKVAPSPQISASPLTSALSDPEEISLIEKYRVLDDYGKKNVNMILNNEFERCIQTDREESEPISSAPSDSAKAG